MGKRKSRSKDKDEDYIRNKIRKLKEKLKDLPSSHTHVDSDVSSVSVQSVTTPPPPNMTVPVDPGPGPSSASEILQQEKDPEEELPEEFISALGTEGEEKPEIGDPIRAELAARWSNIMADGLGKESKTTLLKKYPKPTNFPKAEAPKMNAEILATLSDPSIKRDNRIIIRQNLTGKLMSCLGKSLTCLLKGNINSKTLIEEINDAAKIAAELYYQDSSSRKFFALAGATKTVQEAIKNAKTDEYLFGKDCGEKIKIAQTIKKTSSQIKTSIEKETKKKQGNWRGPSQYQHLQYQRRDGRQQQQQQQQQQHQPPFKKQQRYNQKQKIQKRAPPTSRSRYRQ